MPTGSDKLSRRQYLSGLAAVAGYGYATTVLGPQLLYAAVPQSSRASVVPVHSVLVNFQYEITACCAYYEGNGTYTQFPVKLEPGTKCMELFVTPPGEQERSLSYILGSEILADAHNAQWGGTFPRTSNPFTQGAKGIYSLRLQALTFRSMARFGNCHCPNASSPSLQIDGSYSVLINGEQTPSLPAPYGSFRWSGQNNKPANQQMIWTFDVS
jgi:hypothetical protein